MEKLNVSQLAKDLANVKKDFLTDVKKVNKADAEQLIEKELKQVEVEWQKANEVMHSTNTGFGEELIPASVTIKSVMDVISENKKFAFLDALRPWLHPTEELSLSTIVPIIGEPWFARKANKWTTGAYAPATPSANQRYATDKINIAQQPLYFGVGIEHELWCYSVLDLIAKLNKDVAFVYGQTIADAILNADSNPWATGNINSDDQLATTWLSDGALDRRFIYDGSLRDVGLGTVWANASIGTLTFDDFVGLMALMDASTMPSDMIAIMDNGTYYKLMTLDEFKDKAQNGVSSVITTGAITNIAWVDIFVTEYMRKADTDGKINTLVTTGNVTGTIQLVRRNAVQHGFGCQIQTVVQRGSLEQGRMFEAMGDFGFAVVSNKVWRGNYTVTGYNVTL